jgi:N-acyl-D-amino-acid deacylase
MAERLQEALDAGAIGMSSGLYYAPAFHAPPAELEALAAHLRPAGALYTTHMRDEAEHVEESLDESFHVGRAARVPVVISHHKTTGVANFGRTAQTLPKIAAAMRGQELGLDCYPYIASSTVLRTQRIEDATRVLITWSKAAPEQAGRELTDIAQGWGVGILEAAERLQPAGAIYWMMDEADVRRVLAFEHTMIGSDGLPHDIHPHPRLWGTFPRVLGHYCREIGLFGLETAVHKMTGLSAARFGLTGRGIVAAGAYADLTVFDADTIIDRATFADPTLPAAGIEHVFVNGSPVWSGPSRPGIAPAAPCAASRCRPKRDSRRGLHCCRAPGHNRARGPQGEKANVERSARIRAVAARRARRHRFRPDFSGAVRDALVGEGRGRCDQDRAAAWRAAAPPRGSG